MAAIMWARCISSLTAGGFSVATLQWFLVAVFFTVFALVVIRQLKRVQIGGGKLWVSNHFKEIGVPLEQVYTVYLSQGRGISAEIHLRRETEFGRVIKFYPAGMRVVFNPVKWERETRELLKPSPLRNSKAARPED